MRKHARGFIAFSVLTLALIVCAPTFARAQGFVSPFIGYDFGGDASCPQITNCEDKKLNVGVSLGTMGSILGFEEELAYAKDFFGTAPGLSSSVLTLMSNAMIIPRIGPVRPYALAGLGLIKTHVEFTPSRVLSSTNNNLGWDAGGGIAAFFGAHAGVRGISGSQRARVHVERYKAGFRPRQRGAHPGVLTC
jgi:hypothetical protein